ncbi:MAG: hypothetical protein ACOC3V_03640 [bacterium]
MMNKNKKAQMQMSVGTLVTIVLLMSVLIFGLIFVRSIMCSGIALTDDITKEVEGQIKDLFGSNKYGVKCVGETSVQEIGADGDSKKVGCIIVTDESKDYTFKIVEIEKLSGKASEDEIKSWFLTSEGTSKQAEVSSGDTAFSFITIKAPQDVDATTLEVKIEISEEGAGTTQTKYMTLEITSVGAFTSAIC